MSLLAGEKLEVIRLVEGSELSIRRTLTELGVSRSSFYRWYRQYLDGGPEGLEPASRAPRRFWNKLPESVKEQCLEVALQHPEKSPRELAWHITDEHTQEIDEGTLNNVAGMSAKQMYEEQKKILARLTIEQDGDMKELSKVMSNVLSSMYKQLEHVIQEKTEVERGKRILEEKLKNSVSTDKNK